MTRTAGHLLAALVALVAICGAGYLLATTDSLVAHMVAHVLLVDVVAAGIVLAAPIRWRRALAAAIDAHADSSTGWTSLAARLARSPVALLALWTLTLSALMLPVGHRWSMTGTGRIAEPILVLLVGLAFWRVTFDEHARRPFHEAVLRGGLAWWGRHALAMVGRVAILPAILALWFWPAGAYPGASALQQELAAGVVLGAEMTVFGIAFVLFLVLLVLLEHEPAPSAHRIEAVDGL